MRHRILFYDQRLAGLPKVPSSLHCRQAAGAIGLKVGQLRLRRSSQLQCCWYLLAGLPTGIIPLPLAAAGREALRAGTRFQDVRS